MTKAEYKIDIYEEFIEYVKSLNPVCNNIEKYFNQGQNSYITTYYFEIDNNKSVDDFMTLVLREHIYLLPDQNKYIRYEMGRGDFLAHSYHIPKHIALHIKSTYIQNEEFLNKKMDKENFDKIKLIIDEIIDK